eukprot:CAMPEP_0206140788 /NCGR_PEP_ID=MMETSP1473-20131121/10648_1 /ASSEMBLY_ACC=CAM_ASM_001109 /TAXON_ID=1461547 /ORGANISM="Stichococcus sp, Strain RCC1054" /LENGTH=295 /DNA_ID=CAMNT_0053535073 /DNA_START=138 /DNA_END=1025 /DNA_ORIENTATION=+
MADAQSRQQADLQADKPPPRNLSNGGRASLTVIPLRHNKIVHLVRHGQGFHNVAGEADALEYASEKYFDAHLTELGWKQAADLKAHIKTSPIRPEVVIVSPMMRAMQTAVGAFGGGIWHEDDPALPLMTEVCAEADVSAAHPAASVTSVPFVACELCREHLGVHPCDRRRSLGVYREAFPGIDFSNIKEVDDVLWKPDERETDEQIAERGVQFLEWLSLRPETEIAVVSHSGFLRCMLGKFADVGSDSVRNDLKRYFANCELRTVVVGAANGEGNLDPTWFHPSNGSAGQANGSV